MNPPVEAPTSRQTRPATSTSKRSRAAASLSPPRDDERRPRRDLDGRVFGDSGPGLVDDLAGDAHLARHHRATGLLPAGEEATGSEQLIEAHRGEASSERAARILRPSACELSSSAVTASGRYGRRAPRVPASVGIPSVLDEDVCARTGALRPGARSARRPHRPEPFTPTGRDCDYLRPWNSLKNRSKRPRRVAEPRKRPIKPGK